MPSGTWNDIEVLQLGGSQKVARLDNKGALDMPYVHFVRHKQGL